MLFKLPPPEDYNVIHVGQEHERSVEPHLVQRVRKSRTVSMAAYLCVGMMFFGFLLVNASLYRSLQKSQFQINALVDELGGLNQSNFELSEQVTSQEAVLQSLAKDFSSLYSVLDEENRGLLGNTFSNLFSSLAKDSSVELSEEELSTVVEDETLDVLILGNNGSHTDSILVASINEEKEKVSLFSIPRDLYVNGRRINEYYSYYGIEQMSRMVEVVTGLHMDHYLQVDMSGFVEIVDIVGGLDVYVPESIYDGLYPNGHGGYSAYSIEAGQHHMGGEEALKYARSRKSTSDFDRSERQQSITAALRTKVLQLNSVMDLKELSQIFQMALGSATSDMDLLDLVGFYYDYQEYDLNKGFGLTSGNYLYSLINQSGAYILLPETGNFEEIHDVISDLVN